MNEEMNDDIVLDELDDLDALQLQQAMERLRSEENFFAALLAGVAAGLLGAILWAVITATTGFQIGFMAVGVGFLVGLGVQHFGKGVTQRFGFLGAGQSLVGCALGNLFSVIAVISDQEEIPFTDLLSRLDLEIVKELMILSFHPLDVLFYGLALYYGYKLSFRPITPALLGLSEPSDT